MTCIYTYASKKSAYKVPRRPRIYMQKRNTKTILLSFYLKCNRDRVRKRQAV